MKLNHCILLSAVTLLSACDTAKGIQSFNIYIAGDYGLDEDCQSSTRVNITSKKIISGKSECDVSNISLTENEPGWEFKAQNCVSDLNPEANKSGKNIKILVSEDNNMTLVGWAKEPLKLYRCEQNK